jgi:hypothetical protein
MSKNGHGALLSTRPSGRLQEGRTTLRLLRAYTWPPFPTAMPRPRGRAAVRQNYGRSRSKSGHIAECREVPCVDGSKLARGIFTLSGLVGAAMRSACLCGSHDRSPAELHCGASCCPRATPVAGGAARSTMKMRCGRRTEASWPIGSSSRLRLAGGESRAARETPEIQWWAHKDSNLGPAD